MIKPNYLKKGDTIGLVSPSAPLAGLVPHRVKKTIEALNLMGFNVKIGKNALVVNDYVAGNPKKRAKDINDFFKDSRIKAIISFIGGNHSNQILDYLDFEAIKKNPKIFLGYSDITVLHFALLTQCDLVSFYGPSGLNQFAENPKILPYTKNYFEKALMEASPIGEVHSSEKYTEEILDWFKKEDLKKERKMVTNSGWEWIKKGFGEGAILGGCISSIIHLRGTKFWPNFKDAIFFWEIPEGYCLEKGESLANIDSYLMDLKLSGVFDEIKGMIIGRPFGYTKQETDKLKRMIKRYLNNYDIPILFNVDIGHTDPMITIPLGVKVRIDSNEMVFKFLESGTKHYEK
ncbi:MAG: LD-carboxypeptidase [Candidatus ainarchaeum sp.]|nr:LD-carboxypeptidase [Candidatus ainarchaeum sp.]